MAFNLAQQIRVSGKHADIDERKGPFLSISDALAFNSVASREKGRTVYIIEDNKVVEYWFESGIQDLDLVKKQGGSSFRIVIKDVTMADIGALETNTDEEIETLLSQWINSQNFIIPEGELWGFQLEREGSDSGGSSNLTLEQARQNGNVLEGVILGIEEFDKQGDRKAFAQMSDVYDNIGEGGAITLTRMLPFSLTPNFEFLQTIMFKNVNSPLVFINDTTTAVLGYSCLIKLLADGINLPDFTAFRQVKGSLEYNNVAGILNLVYFYYDGTDVWYNIIQDANGQVETEEPGEPGEPGPETNVVFDMLGGTPPTGATYDPLTNTLQVYSSLNRGASCSTPITLKDGMEFICEPTSSVLMTLDTDLDENYTYGTGNSYIIGVFQYLNTSAYADVNGIYKASVGTNSNINRLKIKKNGTNAECYYSLDSGLTWVLYYTEVGCFYAIDQVYIKIVPTDTSTIKVKHTT